MTKNEEKDPSPSLENKYIAVNIFESQEINLAPVKARKRRMLEDYDYDDPFMEPMEGEYEPVELECKLKNFYVYKGDLPEPAKKIAQKYNRAKKKRETLGIQLNESPIQNNDGQNDEKVGVPEFSNVLLDFEASENYILFKPTWSKTDAKLSNFLFLLSAICKIDKPTELHAAHTVLSRMGLSTELVHLEVDSTPEELVEYYASLKEQLEILYKKITDEIHLETNYIKNGKIFQKFNDNEFMNDLMDFHLYYIRYYSGMGEKNLNTARKRATWAVLIAFPPACTNHTKLKHNINNKIAKIIEEKGYDSEKAAKGEFEKKSAEKTIPAVVLSKTSEYSAEQTGEYPSIGALTAGEFSIETGKSGYVCEISASNDSGFEKDSQQS